MRVQIEGSQAVADAVALCRPEVIAAYPISPQTHIVERLSRKVKQGDVGRCQFLNVESELGALSALIGASAAGARIYTATTSQGLLFMAEAVYNAAGLGLPIVMTIANRAIGAPINIWNDHSDSMALRDAGWIQLFAEDNQEAVDLHIQAFRLAEDLSCPVMVCMDGYILTHAYEPVDLPDQTLVDEFLPPFNPVQMLDPDDPISIGAMVGPEAFTEVRYLSHRQHLRALELIPDLIGVFDRHLHRLSGGLYSLYLMGDADIAVIALGSVNGTIKDAIDELRNEGIAVGCVKIGCYRPFPMQQLRAELEGVTRVIVVEKDLAVGMGGIVSADVQMALQGLQIPVHTVIAGLGGRSISKSSLKRMIQDARAERLSEPHFLDLNWTAINEELARGQDTRRAGPVAERLLRVIDARGARLSEGGTDVDSTYQVLPDRHLHRRNRLLDEATQAVQSRMDRMNSLNSGHRACQGCGEALGARYAVDAAMRASHNQLIAINATGCLEVFSSPYPESSWQIPWMHSLFGNAPAVASGVAAALRAKGRDEVKVIVQGGDGATVDIGLGCLSGMFERNDDVLYLCYDNEAYMNTGIQRSGSTPPFARTNTTQIVGDHPGNLLGTGKNLPHIAMAHGIPYVGTASVADLHDLEEKVTRAMGLQGARYIHIHVPCPLGWGSEPAHTIQVARLAVESGLFPLFEAEFGKVIRSTPMRHKVPVERYLELQTRFKHLFGPPPDTEAIASIQALADHNIATYGLLG